jgi:hypothetical protein
MRGEPERALGVLNWSHYQNRPNGVYGIYSQLKLRQHEIPYRIRVPSEYRVLVVIVKGSTRLNKFKSIGSPSLAALNTTYHKST